MRDRSEVIGKKIWKLENIAGLVKTLFSMRQVVLEDWITLLDRTIRFHLSHSSHLMNLTIVMNQAAI